MALITPDETANIAKNIAQTLKSKAFGGVSKESAEAGIELATKKNCRTWKWNNRETSTRNARA